MAESDRNTWGDCKAEMENTTSRRFDDLPHNIRITVSNIPYQLIRHHTKKADVKDLFFSVF
jgi:hypothetical protein